MTFPIHPSVQIACGDLLSHSMWVTGCSDCDVFFDYSAHVGWCSVSVRPKDRELGGGDHQWYANFRIQLDRRNHEVVVERVQFAIDAITVHRGKCSVSAYLPNDGGELTDIDADDVIPF